MRQELNSHHVNECNKQIVIAASDIGAGKAPTRYCISGYKSKDALAPSFVYNLKFQDGPIADGVNGITHEVLLAILENRLEGFQSGAFACEKNAKALQCVRDCQAVLKSRTDERLERGVEGTHTV